MGSSYFYLEFLLAFLSLLKGTTKFQNPAILALEYTLVPDSSYPVQLNQTLAGYKYALSITNDPSKIVVSGDSAGGTLILSLLLRLGNTGMLKSGLVNGTSHEDTRPGMAVLISPWVTLISPQDKNTASDYLDAENLHLYARQYAGSKISTHDPLISPGMCKDVELWREAAPSKGFFIPFGKEEVFAPEIRDLVRLLNTAEIHVVDQEAKGGIHAWPVASLFLASTREERLKGLKAIVKQISERMGASDRAPKS
jgi:acetyl esterase/lipase